MTVIYDNRNKHPVALSAAVRATIDRAANSHDRIGVVEEVGIKLDKAAEIIGVLAGVLHAKGLLTPAEIDEIIGFDFNIR